MDPMHFLSEQSQTIIKTYNDLHQIAEPSWSEKKTSYYIYQFLKRLGMEIKTFDNHYGIVAEIPGEIEEVVACRADMDALVQEVDGVVQPNHSCGHDAHTTMVMYAALAIAKSNIQPKRTIRFIFQPAEEKAGGAVQMMKDGALENVKTLFGIHLRPHMEVLDGKASAVIIHGSSVNLTGKIKGVQAHASRPEEGINAIEAATFVVQCLKEIHLDTSESFSIKMTQLQTGGNASNVIPESATFTLDLRAQTNEAMDKLKEKAELILEHVSKLSGTSIDWKFEEFVPAASPNENAMKLAQEAIEEILGQENFVPVCTSKGGEDFHFYTFEHPEIEATMIGLGCDLRPGLHHPKMTFNVNSLINGAQILTKALIKAAER